MTWICIVINWLKSSRYFEGVLYKVGYDHDEEYIWLLLVYKKFENIFVCELVKKVSF